MAYFTSLLDPTMLIVLPGLLIALWAQVRVQSVFARYEKVSAARGITAAQVARELLQQSGIVDVAVERVPGRLTDHFDPQRGVLSLSEATYDSDSIAAIGVAAHEVGHVYQHYEQYTQLRMRSAFVPVAQIGSQAAVPLFILGMILAWEPLMWAGIAVFMAVVLFHLATLPVEFNASGRALAALEGGGYLTSQETDQAGKVLRAAGLTYIAATLQAMLQLLRLLVIAGGRRRRD